MSDPPQKTGGDVAHALVKAALAAVPIAGGSAAELFALIVAPPIERRRELWFAEIETAVNEIRSHVADLTPEGLSENETFVTTLLHATQIASRTHQDEKIAALRNAVINSALDHAPDETFQSIFLHYVDELTPWHLRILAFFHDPSAGVPPRSGALPIASSPSAILEMAIPELRGRRDFYDQLVLELENRGLMSGNIHGMTTGPGAVSPRTKPLGEQFLRFISAQGG